MPIEGYKPPQEEVSKAEGMTSDEQRGMSEQREREQRVQETADEKFARERLQKLSLKELNEATAEGQRRANDYEGRLGVITGKLGGRYPMKGGEDRDTLARDESELQLLIAKQRQGIEQDQKDRAAKVERGLLSPEDHIFLVEGNYHNITKVPSEMIPKTAPGPDTPRTEAMLWRANQALQRETEARNRGQTFSGSPSLQEWVRKG